MTAVGDARKRQQEAQAPLSQPIPAPVDSGAIGRLNEALAAAIDGEWTRPEHDWERMGFDELRDAAVTAVDRIVREHTDRALAEVERALVDAKLHFRRTTGAGSGDVISRVYEDSVRIVRAARQERGR